MPLDPFPAQELTLLFDRDASARLTTWLPSDKQLQQWVLVALTHSLSEEQRGRMIEISLSCVCADDIRELNAQDGNTTQPLLVLGDVVVCPQVMDAEASLQHKSLEDHWAHMLIHSVLHLNGYDHDNAVTADAMELLEIQILSGLGIANPYIATSAKQS